MTTKEKRYDVTVWTKNARRVALAKVTREEAEAYQEKVDQGKVPHTRDALISPARSKRQRKGATV